MPGGTRRPGLGVPSQGTCPLGIFQALGESDKDTERTLSAVALLAPAPVSQELAELRGTGPGPGSQAAEPESWEFNPLLRGWEPDLREAADWA